MDSETFGPVKKYKALGLLTDKIRQMDENPRIYISSFIRNFNTVIKKTEQIQDLAFRKYLLDLVYSDSISRVDNFIIGKYDDRVVSYLKNFIYAKTKNAQKSALEMQINIKKLSTYQLNGNRSTRQTE